MKFKCYLCNELILNSHHLKKCSKLNNINFFIAKKEQIYFKIEHYMNLQINETILIDLYINQLKSLPDLKKIFNISYKEIIFLLDFFKIPRRSIKQASKQTVIKQIETLKEKYNVTNISQLEFVKEKKKEICLEKYGVDNIFKDENFKKNRNEKMFNIYGKFSITSKDSKHKNLTKEEKEELYKNLQKNYKLFWYSLSTIDKNKIIQKRKIFISKLEIKISKILFNNNIPFRQQFFINNFSYDFKLNNKNILIEINGDFWHANPIFYKKNDILPFPNTKGVLAESLWIKDNIKKENAINKGFKIIYIWENEIKLLSDIEIINLILKRIENENN